MENNNELIASCEAKAKEWLSPSFNEETQKAVRAMLDNSDKTELIDSFYKDLEFGTGGLRGIMGAGSNRMLRKDMPIISKSVLPIKHRFR